MGRIKCDPFLFLAFPKNINNTKIIEVHMGQIRDIASDVKKIDTIESNVTQLQVQQPTAVSQLTNDSGYQTLTQVQTRVDNAITALVDSAPGTLNTLNELAAALGDDPNFATSVTNMIAGKANLSGGTFTGNVTVNGLLEVKDPGNYYNGHMRVGAVGQGFPYVNIGMDENDTDNPGMVVGWYIKALGDIITNRIRLGGVYGQTGQIIAAPNTYEAQWTTIKTVNGTSILGAGDIIISAYADSKVQTYLTANNYVNTTALNTAISTKVDKINITGATVGSGTQIPVIVYNAQGQITSTSVASIDLSSKANTGGSNATGTWPISITGTAVNMSQGFLEAGSVGRSASHAIGANIGATTPSWNNAQLELRCIDAGTIAVAFHRAGYTSNTLSVTDGNGIRIDGYPAMHAGNFGNATGSNLLGSSRAAGTTYTNSRATPLIVWISGTNAPSNGTFTVRINGNIIGYFNGYGTSPGGTVIIPPGSTYSITNTGATVQYWYEY